MPTRKTSQGRTLISVDPETPTAKHIVCIFLAAFLTVTGAVVAQTKPQQSDPIWLLSQGKKALQRKDCDNAVKFFRQVLELVPDDPIATKGLKECGATAEQQKYLYFKAALAEAFDAGDYDSGRQYLEMALKASPQGDDMSAYAVRLLENGNQKECGAWLEIIANHGGRTSSYDNVFVEKLNAVLRTANDDSGSLGQRLAPLKGIEPSHPFWASVDQESGVSWLIEMLSDSDLPHYSISVMIDGQEQCPKYLADEFNLISSQKVSCSGSKSIAPGKHAVRVAVRADQPVGFLKNKLETRVNKVVIDDDFVVLPWCKLGLHYRLDTDSSCNITREDFDHSDGAGKQYAWYLTSQGAANLPCTSPEVSSSDWASVRSRAIEERHAAEAAAAQAATSQQQPTYAYPQYPFITTACRCAPFMQNQFAIADIDFTADETGTYTAAIVGGGGVGQFSWGSSAVEVTAPGPQRVQVGITRPFGPNTTVGTMFFGSVRSPSGKISKILCSR